MPRQSVEAKAGAKFRARPSNTLPEPPEHLSQEARKLWDRILASKPADWFEEGNLPILAQYCDLVAEQAKLVLQRNELEQLKPANLLDRTEVLRARLDVNRSVREHALASTTLAVKLRLTVQNTIDRKAGILTEKQPEAVVAAAARSSLLSGRQLDS
jgi:hypothetical protein